MLTPRTGLFLSALAFASGCNSAHPARVTRDAATATAEGLLVTVNGHPLTRADVQVSIRTASTHGGAAETESEALERIIHEELLAQHALELNLDADPAFRDPDRLAEARFLAARRSQLAALYERHQSAQRPTVSDAEVRAYYTANATRIRSEVRIQQILVRDEAVARQAVADLRGGAAFEEVAARQFPGVSPTLHPWDLGFLRWNVTPDAWRTTVDGMTAGQTSDVISGPNHRYWVIKLLERREVPDITVDVARPAIIERLQEQHTVALRTDEAAALRRRAQIVYPAARP